MLTKEYPIQFVRPAWIVGKASWFKHFYLKFISEHQIVPIFGDKTRLMNLIHVEDCAAMIIHYALNAEHSRAYNLFVPEAITAEEFASILSKKLNLPIKHFSEKETKKMFDAASYEALTSSIALSTKATEVKDSYQAIYNTPEQIISAAL